MAQLPQQSVKICLLGAAAVGKSSLVMRFVQGEYVEKEPTIGAAFLTQRCPLDTRIIKFEIWDTAGQERFASLAPMYYRNAQAALVVYDLYDHDSLNKARYWVGELQRQASPGIKIALVGNKLDMDQERAAGSDAEATAAAAAAATMDSPSDEEDIEAYLDRVVGTPVGQRVPTKVAHGYADREDLLFFETSAKDGSNVHAVFKALAKAMPEPPQMSPRAGTTRGSVLGADDARVNVGTGGSGDVTAKENCAC